MRGRTEQGFTNGEALGLHEEHSRDEEGHGATSHEPILWERPRDWGNAGPHGP